MQELIEKYSKHMPVAAGVILLSCIGLFVAVILPSTQVRTSNNQTEPNFINVGTDKQEFQPKEAQFQDWYVYVTGAVTAPGVYKISRDSRVFQAIEAAGGFNGFADRTLLNLAEQLSDGTHIHVLKKGELDSLSFTASPTPAPGVYVPVKATEQKQQKIVISGGSKINKSNSNGYEMVDINHASERELEKLRGVGPAIAKRIAEYRRTHGAFRNADELINVRGIGSSKLKNMRNQIIIR